MRNGHWFLTFTGRQFWPVDPDPKDIAIEDIAHALSQVCRFGGHCRHFYSVAQHSVLVSRHCVNAPLQGLMHDATEAYLGDMVKPLKLSMPDYRVAEERVWEAVCERFDLSKLILAEVKICDNRALMTERRDLCTPTAHVWSLDEQGVNPYPEQIFPLHPCEAETEFLKRWEELR